MVTNEPRTLQEYLTWAKSEIDKGKPLDAGQIIGGFTEYPSGQTYINANPQKALAPLAATSPEESRELLRQFFKGAEVVVVYPEKPTQPEAQRLTQFNTPVEERAQERPTPTHSPEKMPSLVQALQESTEQRVAQVRQDVRDYVDKLRKQGVKPPQGLETVVDEVCQPVYEPTLSGVREVLNERAETLTPELRQTVTTLSQDPSVLRDVMAASEVIAGAAALNENVTITQPKDVHDLIAAVPSDAVINGRIDPGAIGKTTEYAKIKTIVNAPKKDYSGMDLGDLLHGPIAPMANALSALPGVRDEAFRRALENALNKTVGELQQRLGAGVVNDPRFQLILRSAQNAALQKEGARTFFGGIGRFFGDLMEPIRGPASERLIMLLQAYYENPAASMATILRDYGASRVAYSWNSAGVLLIGQKAATSGAVGAAKGISSVGFTATRKAITSRVLTFLVKLGLPEVIAGFLSGGIAWVVAIAVAAFDLVKGALSGLFNALTLGVNNAANAVAGGLRGSLNLPPPKKDWIQKNQLFVAILISVLALLGVGWIGNGAALDSIQLQTGGGEWGPTTSCDPTTDPTCPAPFCDPSKQDCSWPVPCGCITQGPFTTGGTHDHANAVDIGVNNSSVCGASVGYDNPPVYSTCDGTVAAIHTGETNSCATESECTANHINIGGNMVEINCSDGKTQLLFAHLLNVDGKIMPGAPETKGQLLGRADNTGHSSGPHLHYEARGVNGGSVPLITTMLPSEYALGYCWSSK